MMEFREMRRKRQQLAEEESIAILEKATAGTLALLGDNDYPYAVPISYVYHDGKLYFHSALAGHKVDAIRKCDKASFCVIEKDDVQPEKYTTFFRSVIAFGRIHIIEDKYEKLEIARMLGNRYNPNQDEALQKEIESGLSRMLVIRFGIEHAIVHVYVDDLCAGFHLIAALCLLGIIAFLLWLWRVPVGKRMPLFIVYGVVLAISFFVGLFFL